MTFQTKGSLLRRAAVASLVSMAHPLQVTAPSTFEQEGLFQATSAQMPPFPGGSVTYVMPQLRACEKQLSFYKGKLQSAQPNPRLARLEEALKRLEQRLKQRVAQKGMREQDRHADKIEALMIAFAISIVSTVLSWSLDL